VYKIIDVTLPQKIDKHKGKGRVGGDIICKYTGIYQM
jgi:hypothetical protein